MGRAYALAHGAVGIANSAKLAKALSVAHDASRVAIHDKAQ
jgi:hypothetical protein